MQGGGGLPDPSTLPLQDAVLCVRLSAASMTLGLSVMPGPGCCRMWPGALALTGSDQAVCSSAHWALCTFMQSSHVCVAASVMVAPTQLRCSLQRPHYPPPSSMVVKQRQAFMTNRVPGGLVAPSTVLQLHAVLAVMRSDRLTANRTCRGQPAGGGRGEEAQRACKDTGTSVTHG